MAEIDYKNTGQVIDPDESAESESKFYEPTEGDKELLQFVVDHTDRWRDYRDQNFMDEWERYERTFRGVWDESDKTRQSERSRVISPATQQAIETRHAEIMEAIFGQGEFFDIKDDLRDQTGPLDVEQMKAQLNEDFSQDKIRKAIDQIVLLGELYGTGIGEITVSQVKSYRPMRVPMGGGEMAYGVGEEDRISVRLVPVNPRNFLFDPNGTCVEDCMGVAIEREVSIHTIVKGIADGRYLPVDVAPMYSSDDLEPTQQTTDFKDEKVKILTYYGLVPKEYLTAEGEEVVKIEGISEENEDYADMVEAIVVIANGGLLLKREETPYMMKDRPVLTYQSDTVPNRLLGRGTAEKAMNMQMAIDGSARSHMDALALTIAPMLAADATRLPRGTKLEIKPGKSLLTNGDPNGILMPFKFGAPDGSAIETSKEFERLLLMATSTIDSQGTNSQVSRDGNMDMATATMIKKYKRTLVNFQEDFLIPFVKKAAWRYMQFDPTRYPSRDVKFLPTATLGIIAREYEQKQLAFLVQTLGAQSPLAPILMQSIVKNSSLSNREQLIQQLQQMSQPNPQQQQMAELAANLDFALKKAEVEKTQAEARKIETEIAVAPDIARAKVIAAISTNLTNGAEERDFERRLKLADLALKEEDIRSNERIATMQVSAKREEKAKERDYLKSAV